MTALVTRRRGIVLAGATVAVLALHVVLVWPVHGFLLSDTTGYLANARWFAGKAGETWQGAMSFYHPAWSILVAPLYLVFDSPRDVQVGALLLNALLASAILPLAYVVARRAFDVPPRAALGGAAIAALYPAVVLLAGYEWGESLYQVLFLLFVLAAAAVVAKPTTWSAVAVGVVAAACNATHPRGLGMVPVAFGFLAALAWRKQLPRVAAAAGIGALVVAFAATRVVDHLLLDAIYSKTSAGVEGDVLGRLTDVHLLWGGVKAAIGQLWYLTVATLGLAPIGALWLLTTKRLPTALRLVTLVACLATLAASSLEMSDGIRVDHMVYGRYVEGIVPVLLVAGAAGLVAWRTVLPRLLGGVAVLAVVLAVALVVVRRGGDLFSGDVMPLNVLGLLPFRDGTGPDVLRIDVARTTILALVGAGVVVAATRWKAVAGLAVVAALFAGGAATVQANTLRPFDDRWAGFLQIPHAVRAVSDGGAVAYDRAGYEVYAAAFYQLMLSDRGVRFFDSRDGQPFEDLVIGSPDRVPVDGARLVTAEVGPYGGQALWVAPGALQARLAREGFLLPEDPAAPIPDPEQRIRTHVPARLDAGAGRKLDVDVTHLGAGVAWHPLVDPRYVTGAVRLSARWLDPAGTAVATDTAELPRVLLPGDAVHVALPITAPPAGTYRLEVGLRQEGGAWFPHPATFTVEVR
jgi:hypothetical protein